MQTTNAGSTQSRVRLISTRQPDDPGVPSKTAAPVSTPSNHAFLQQMLIVMTAIAGVAATRMLLLLAMVGATVLAFMATQNPEPFRLVATVIYDLGVIGPITYLYLVKG